MSTTAGESSCFDDVLTDAELDVICRDLGRTDRFSSFVVRKLVAEIVRLRAQPIKTTTDPLNPSTETLDAEAYRYLRDEIAATMADDWDGDEAESWILARYVRWLAAGQPRDADGYPVRRESYPAAETASQPAQETDSSVADPLAAARGFLKTLREDADGFHEPRQHFYGTECRCGEPWPCVVQAQLRAGVAVCEAALAERNITLDELIEAAHRRRAGVEGIGATQVRTPEQWCAHYGVEIHDPDGWRSASDPPWNQPLTLPDFWERAKRSTLRNVIGGGWERVGRDARTAHGGAE